MASTETEKQTEKRLLLSKQQARNLTTTHTKKEISRAIAAIAESPRNVSALAICLEKLTSYSTKLATLTDNIQLLIDDSALEADVKKADEIQEQTLDAIARIKAALADPGGGLSPTLPDEGGPERNYGIHSVRLPKLEMKSFDGDPMKWEEFWDTYKSTVHENRTLPPIDKFKYLKGLLEGRALVLAEGYRLTAANYDTVIAALKERFGNPELAIFSHFDSMLALFSGSDGVLDLQKTFDECEKHIRSLVALGLDEAEFGRVFTPIIMSKLPSELRVELHRRNGSVPWTLANLRAYFKEEIQARDMSSRSFGSRSDKKEPSSKKEAGNRPSLTWKEGQATASALVSSDKGRWPNRPSSMGSKPQCRFCQGSHFSDQYQQYPDAATRRRRAKNLCFAGLGKGHLSRQCRVAGKCYYCGLRGHNRSLCLQKFGLTSKVSQKKPEEDGLVRVTETMVIQGSRGVLQTALAPVKGAKSTAQARLLLDNGADNAFITNRLAKQLGAQVLGEEIIALAGFQDSKRSQTNRRVFQFDILLKNGDQFPVKAYGTDQITCPIDKYAIDTNTNSITTQLPLADPLITEDTQVSIDILLGSDYYYKLLHMATAPIVLDSGLVLLSSKLGYIIGGSVDGSGPCKTTLLLSKSKGSDCLDSSLERLWSLEEIGIKEETETPEDVVAMNYFKETIIFDDETSRYEVRWPWNGKQYELPDNYGVALGRLKSLMNSLSHDSGIGRKYNDNIQEQLSTGIIEEAPDIADGNVVHYLPHRGVVTPQKATTKLRIVFDGSCRQRKESLSINDCMYRGPILLENLCGLLIRFRLHPVGIVSDLEKAFLQVGLQKSDRDAVRFLWPRDVGKPVSNSNLLCYRFRRVCFGIVSSPFLLAATLLFHLDRLASPLSSEIKRSFYVDNLILGRRSTQEAFQFFVQAKDIFAKASMNLREWFSNDRGFMDQLPSEDRGNSTATKVLGLTWNLQEDMFICHDSPRVGVSVDTKRTILQEVAKVYDPCGYWSPVTTPGKWLMQQLWQKDYQWDEPLPAEVIAKWGSLKQQLQLLSSCPIKRYCGFDPYSKEAGLELHCFCDSSAKAYCGAVYMRLPGNQPVLVFSKSRVCPLKSLSIPRLELLASLIGTRLVAFVSKQLDVAISAKYLWSDSQSVLHWILGRCPTTAFVKNRVEEIRKNKDVRFRYIATADNPADLPTRGVTVQTLKCCSLWWHGPSWLDDDSQWPDPTLPEVPESTIMVEDATATERTYPSQVNNSLLDMERYSTLSKLLRVTAWILRFVHNLVKADRKSGGLSASELDESKLLWETWVQSRYFGSVLQSKGRILGPLKGLAPLFVDQNGILRRKGRLEYSGLWYDAQNPKIMPKNCHYVSLLIKDYHERLSHAGIGHVLAEIRSEYWLVHARSQIKRIIARWLKCRRLFGGSYKAPLAPDLPGFRVSDMRPFSCVGVDYFGPLYVATEEKGQPSKAWVLLFTCASTRAVHLELVTRMDVDDFLLAFRRFISLCGSPVLIVSDNAKQFHSAKRLFDRLWYHVLEDRKVTDFSAARKIQWKFIPEAAPWMGGFYERLVGLVKRSLKGALQRARLSVEELRTCIYETTTIVNSRPLVYVEEDENELLLTPSHFAYRHHSLFPAVEADKVHRVGETSNQEGLIRRWRTLQHRLDQIWRTWRKAYVSSLPSYRGPYGSHRVARVSPEVGEVVLVHDSRLPRGKWRIARIASLIPSGDNEIRSVKLRLPDGKHIVRPVKLLHPLETQLGRAASAKDPRDTPAICDYDSSEPQMEVISTSKPLGNSVSHCAKIPDPNTEANQGQENDPGDTIITVSDTPPGYPGRNQRESAAGALKQIARMAKLRQI